LPDVGSVGVAREIFFGKFDIPAIEAISAPVRHDIACFEAIRAFERKEMAIAEAINTYNFGRNRHNGDCMTETDL
jgi:hypothetical protein